MLHKPTLEPDYDSLEFHEFARVDRMMNEDEFETLKANIAKDGIWDSHRITLFEGKILAGRNRYNAAKQAEYVLKLEDVEQFKENVKPAQH